MMIYKPKKGNGNEIITCLIIHEVASTMMHHNQLTMVVIWRSYTDNIDRRLDLLLVSEACKLAT